MVADVATYVPGYRLGPAAIRSARRRWDGNGRVTILVEVEGGGDFLPVRRQPGHYDRGRRSR